MLIIVVGIYMMGDVGDMFARDVCDMIGVVRCDIC